MKGRPPFVTLFAPPWPKIPAHASTLLESSLGPSRPLRVPLLTLCSLRICCIPYLPCLLPRKQKSVCWVGVQICRWVWRGVLWTSVAATRAFLSFVVRRVYVRCCASLFEILGETDRLSGLILVFSLPWQLLGVKSEPDVEEEGGEGEFDNSGV